MKQEAGGTAAAGWYPDPEQVQTVRFWDGEKWTEQRAPATHPKQLPVSVIAGTGITIAGIAAVMLGLFLPYADPGRFGHIVDNTMISNDTTGKVLLGLATIAIIAIYENHQQKGWKVSVLLIGLVTLGLTIFIGANMGEIGVAHPEDLEGLGLNASDFREAANPGVGVYVAGVGGLLLSVGGYLLAGKRT